MKKLIKLAVISLCLGGIIACTDGANVIDNDNQIRDYTEFFSPLPSAAVYPKDNPHSPAKEQLGELLFWDPILSGDRNVACATCHHPDFGWADGRPLSVGSDGLGLGPERIGVETTPFHSPTIMNVAFTGLTSATLVDFTSGGYFWDLRALTLEEQALGPITNPVEMLGYNFSVEEILDEVSHRVANIPKYTELFAAAFDDKDPINAQNIAKALATFQRKIISPASRFDLFLQGDITALNEQEIIGLNTFIDGGCVRCHLGPMLSDNLINESEAIINDVVVRTPTLRNLSFTAPYMHDGSRATLIDALNDYEERDDLEVSVAEGDFPEIEAFLRSLDSAQFYRQKPTSVPSGLSVGGDID